MVLVYITALPLPDPIWSSILVSLDTDIVLGYFTIRYKFSLSQTIPISGVYGNM